ncbi:serine proteinase stubble-like isoform X1 [Vespula pensylvanica]|uniref:serine proteinase stubble-like isoform X1 n=2 Tax=Vespula pensylvanica TaxID=30213 RepID=UPI001CBA348A|nr:serine proteinase stubble-like isoform X1 [Vespula pensylvanica]
MTINLKGKLFDGARLKRITLMFSGIRMRWIGYVATILWWSGIARSLSTVNRGHSYKISPKPCKVPGPGDHEGTCMFVWECIKSEGTHVGVCVDTFMFGSCCVHNSTVNSIASPGHQSNQQEQDHRHKQQGNSQHHHHHLHHESNTLRPTLAEVLGSETTRFTVTSLSNFPISSTSKPSSVHQQLSSHAGFVVSPRPFKTPSSNVARPLQKRPHAKPTSEHTDRFQTSVLPAGSSPIYNSSQGTKRPNFHESSQLPQQKIRPDGNADDKVDLQLQGHGNYQGFKDKVGSSPNTLVIRLPGKEHASNDGQSKRPNWPNNQRPSESRPDDEKAEDADLSVQETIHRPYVNSVNENEPLKNQHSSINLIYTERPQWATKPATPKPLTDFSKPYFSIKTTTFRPISLSSQTDARPTFVLKPNTSDVSLKTATSPRPTYFNSQPTRYSTTWSSNQIAAGSVPQTSHWQVTTEPAFVTKQRPSSSSSSTSLLSSSSTSSSSVKPITVFETTRPFGASSYFWSENSWTPPRPSLKPHWTDNPSLMQNGPESFPHRPSFKPTESQEKTEYHKPVGSAHYITTSHFETSTRTRPMKKTTTSTTSTTTTTTTSTTTTSTITTTTEKPSTTTTTTTTTKSTESILKSTTPEALTKTGTMMTVSAVAENKGTQCGVPPLFPLPETRIVGGKDAPFGRWPWQVSVRRTSFFGFSSTHRCGGAVLNENWIATAGHCVDDLLTSQIRIRVGEYDFSSVQERLPYVERGVAKKVVHPKYNFFTYEYDLALVRLESPLTFAPHISPICLPATDDLLIGENATVTGWGRLSEGGTLPSVLQEVSVPIVSNDRCKSMFLRAGRHEFIPDIFLCAGYETGGQDSCQGDSGGPLQVRGKDGRYFLAGIISWGIGCAEANLPGVCTRISKFVPWILKNVT